MAVKWTKQALAGFKAGKPVSQLAKELKASQNTLRSVLKRELGEKTYQELVDANSPKRSSVSRQSMVASFHTESTFKSLARSFGTSPNTLRKVWEEEFGKEAVKARSKKFHSAAGFRAGKAGKGKKRGSEEDIKERDAARGVDLWCPVCGKGCVGNQALVNHMIRSGHPEADIATVRNEIREKRVLEKWGYKTEGVDYIRCNVCGFLGSSLTNHLKIHGLSAYEYHCKYPDSLIIAPKVEEGRVRSVQTHANTRKIRVAAEDLNGYLDEKGRVLVTRAAHGLGVSRNSVLLSCRELGLETRNSLEWQRAVLDAASQVFGDYEWEWSHPDLTNPVTGRKFNFDGYFPRYNLIIEAHGSQHFEYSELWHGELRNFHLQVSKDAYKKQKAQDLGYNYAVVTKCDPIQDPSFWHSLFQEEDQTQVISEIYENLVSGGFPSITPDPRYVKRSQSNLSGLSVSTVSEGGYERVIRPYSTLGTLACASYFPGRYKATRGEGTPSAWDLWHQEHKLKRAIKLQLDSGHPTTPERVLKALVLFSKTPSVFRPAVACYIYRNYAKNGVVWDPCAGYGGRLLAAMASGVSMYIGTDLEADTIAGNILLGSALDCTSKCILEVANCMEYTPKRELDLVFTSPPYFDVEVYGRTFSNHIRTFSGALDWAHSFLGSLVRTSFNSLKPGGHLILNLPSRPIDGVSLPSECRDIAGSLGLVEEPSLHLPVRAFKKGLKYEPILVWRKP